MGIDGTLFKIIKLLHVLTAIIGFGAILLNGLYAAEARRRKGAEGLAISEANFKVAKVANYSIYAVFVLGFALVGTSDGFYKVSQTFVWLSAVLFVAMIGLSHSVLQPTIAKMIGLQRELVAGGPPPAGSPPGPPPQVVQMEELAKKLPPVVMALDLMLVVVLGLMVWRPGV